MFLWNFLLDLAGGFLVVVILLLDFEEDVEAGGDSSVNAVSLFPHASGITILGGNFYAVRGNVVSPQTSVRHRSTELKMTRAIELLSQTNDGRMQRLEEVVDGLQLPPTIPEEVLYLIDAAGRRHPLAMNMAFSLPNFIATLKILFNQESPQDILLRKSINIQAFVLIIDNGKEPLEILSQDIWSRNVQRGTTIVMSIAMPQPAHKENKYRCPLCGWRNRLAEKNVCVSIHCKLCKRYFYVSPAHDIETMTVMIRSKLETIDPLSVPSKIEWDRNFVQNIMHRWKHERHLIQNISVGRSHMLAMMKNPIVPELVADLITLALNDNIAVLNEEPNVISVSTRSSGIGSDENGIQRIIVNATTSVDPEEIVHKYDIFWHAPIPLVPPHDCTGLLPPYFVEKVYLDTEGSASPQRIREEFPAVNVMILDYPPK